MPVFPAATRLFYGPFAYSLAYFNAISGAIISFIVYGFFSFSSLSLSSDELLSYFFFFFGAAEIATELYIKSADIFSASSSVVFFFIRSN